MVQYPEGLSFSFSALSDSTRRGILERLTKGPASISDLAGQFQMTLTGLKKHVQVLEDAGLVMTKKHGRVRTVALGPRRLDDEVRWLESYRKMLNERLNSLEEFLENTRDKS